MLDVHINRARITQFIARVKERRYRGAHPLAASYIYNPRDPVPYGEALKGKYRPITVGTPWGELWGSGWFRFTATVPPALQGTKVAALIDIGGEGCVFEKGEPVQGLTTTNAWGIHLAKRVVPISEHARRGEPVSLLVEVAANDLFGAHGGKAFTLNTAELVAVNASVVTLYYDLLQLESLMKGVPETTPRFHRIVRGLCECANLWSDGTGIDACLAITRKLLAARANASALTAWSIGHAHLDLGWLWPTRETKRKGGRTFATALRLMEEYPHYRFGCSQPQLYEWVKECYPGLYARVKEAVAQKRWECQGAMWVEADMNVTGGESLVRQCLYGKRFFREEFGVDVRNLWLPDVFGYSAALPQILKKAGVDYFMTQKISWSELNTFPHHTFMWEGIDGTAILTHFLPTNDYNAGNWASNLAEAEKRYAQSDVCDDFLNLFGVGDGGGGPGRAHLEFGNRVHNTEGCPKVKYAFAEEFFKKIDKVPKEKLPRWVGELYLELHRGTYTTQGVMKRDNRLLELRLRDTEFLCAVAGLHPKKELDRIWKQTLLNQFHDILPGSSIGMVYEQAHRESSANLASLEQIRKEACVQLNGKSGSGAVVLYNTLGWERTEVVRLPAPRAGYTLVDAGDTPVPVQKTGSELFCRVRVPPLGYTTLRVRKAPAVAAGGVKARTTQLENELVRVTVGADGTITSIFDKEIGIETLASSANRLELWEDLPRDWDAWDIAHYYRETTPEQARRVSVEVVDAAGVVGSIAQKFTIGNSAIDQRLSLQSGSKQVTIATTVDWQECHKMLRVSASTAIKSTTASFEIQYGTIKRPVHDNTSWDRARFEVCGHRFADLSREDYGFALLNDCKYGYYVRDGILDLALLRSPVNPDEKADIGTHAFTYAYLPHTGRLESSEVLRRAHALNAPLLPFGVARAPEQREGSWFALDAEGVIVEAVKPAENGEGIVLRLYESRGAREQVTLRAAAGWKSVIETSLLEEPLAPLCGRGDVCGLTFKPFEIRTLVLHPLCSAR